MARSVTLQWILSVAVGGLLAVVISFPWAVRTPFQPAAVIAEVLERIDRHYVEPTDAAALTERVLSAITENLDDRWSAFIPPAQYMSFDEESEGRFGGIGVFYGRRDGHWIVLEVLGEGPAARAGVCKGDALVRADGVELAELDEDHIKRLLRGVEGTVLTLELRDPGGAVRGVKIVRAVIHDPSVYRVALVRRTPPLGMVRIDRFQRGTARELDAAVNELEAAGVAGLILDLRENPGGLYDEAITVADRFLSEGVIVSTQGRGGRHHRVERATAGPLYPDVPVVVLVNGGTASAAEIVAAALRDHGRAVLLGSETFGKGSVQSVYQIFGDGRVFGALKLTTKRYVTPNGHVFAQGGLIPHRECPQAGEELARLLHAWRRDMQRHWNDPARLLEDLDASREDACLAAAMELLLDEAAYRAVLPPRGGTP